MPGIDGFQASTQILQNPKFANIPIVMCTGKESDDDRQKAFDLGAAGYMNKSSSSEPLNAILEEFTRQETQILPNTNAIDLDEIYKQIEQTSTEIASKVSEEKIALFTEECARNSNNQVTSLTEKLEQEIIITAKHSLEDTYALVDKKISHIEETLLPDLKDELSNDLSTAVHDLRNELNHGPEMNALEAQIADSVKQGIYSELESHAEQLLKTESAKSLVETMVQERLQEQLTEHDRKIQSLQDIVAENATRGPNTSGIVAILFSIIALAAALYPTLKELL